MIDQEIPEQLSAATCGWVNTEEHVGDVVGDGLISRVRGLPGHDGEPLGLLRSGMARRIDTMENENEETVSAFTYPNTAFGYSTACPVTIGDGETPKIHWSVWRDPDVEEPQNPRCTRLGDLPTDPFASGAYVEYECEAPRFGDPSCNAAPGTEDGDMTPQKCEENCRWQNGEEFQIQECKEFRELEVWQNPDGSLFLAEPGTVQFGAAGTRTVAKTSVQRSPLLAQSFGDETDGQTPTFDDSENPFIYPEPDPQFPFGDYTQGYDPQPEDPYPYPEPDPEPYPEPYPEPEPEPRPEYLYNITRCNEWTRRYVCTGHYLPTEPDDDKEDWQQAEYPNCRECRGQECRCPGPDCKRVPEPPEAGSTEYTDSESLLDTDRQGYLSFFREYYASAVRRTLPETPDDALAVMGDEEFCADVNASRQDRLKECIISACYYIYEEIDPLTRRTTPEDQRCIIRFPRELPQSLLGNTQTNVNAYVRNPVEEEPVSTRERVPEAAENPWEPVLDTLSFLDPNSPAAMQRSLTTAILTRDTVRLRAEPALPDVALPLGNLQNDTDDTVHASTGDARFVTRWLQDLLTDIQSVLQPPLVRVKLPALWERFLRPTTAAGTPAPVLPNIDATTNRTLSVDLQVRAGPGLVDELSDLFRQVFTIRKENLSVVVPLGSRVTFENEALRWERYKNEREKRGQNVPDEVNQLISRLHEYANQMDQVRELRAQLPLYLALVVERQGQAIERINDWVAQNAERYQEILDANEERRRLAPLAQQIAKEAVAFSDGQINVGVSEDGEIQRAQLWCSNTRFTVPIYSLLDPWLPGRPSLTGGIASCDVQDDRLPKVCPPNDQRELVYDLSTLAVQPGSLVVPSFTVTSLLFKLPPVPSDSREDVRGDTLKLPPPWKVGEISWEERFAPTFEALDPAPPLPQLPTFDRESVRPAMQRALEILVKRNTAYSDFYLSLAPSDRLTNLACEKAGVTPCSHTEGDLLERVMRFVARPGAIVAEDLMTPGARRYPDGTPDTRGTIDTEWAIGCDPADHSCSPFRSVRMLPSDGWQILRGDQGQEPPIDQLRRSLRQETLKDDGTYRTIDGLPLPYRANPEDVYPAVEHQADTDLTP